MLVECNVETPAGFRIICYRTPKKGEVYLDILDKICMAEEDYFVKFKAFILQPIDYINNLAIGDKFTFPNSIRQYQKVDLDKRIGEITKCSIMCLDDFKVTLVKYDVEVIRC